MVGLGDVGEGKEENVSSTGEVEMIIINELVLDFSERAGRGTIQCSRALLPHISMLRQTRA